MWLAVFCELLNAESICLFCSAMEHTPEVPLVNQIDDSSKSELVYNDVGLKLDPEHRPPPTSARTTPARASRSSTAQTCMGADTSLDVLKMRLIRDALISGEVKRDISGQQKQAAGRAEGRLDGRQLEWAGYSRHGQDRRTVTRGTVRRLCVVHKNLGEILGVLAPSTGARPSRWRPERTRR